MHRSYVTTAIPYVNGAPHLGFALELVQADVVARYRRLRGDETRFLTGTDDNALKNVQAAERAGIPVRTLVERNAERFVDLGRILGISNDDFIRTSSDARHVAGAQAFWRACERSGDVYRRSYEGLYCVECERYYAEDELIGGKCPEHDEAPVRVEEENYFFRLSRYQEALERLLDTGTLRILPESRHRETRAFVARGLQDFSISRSRARAHGWGIDVTGDPTQVIYVWFDALTNYITALGYGGDDGLYQRFWRGGGERVHLIGKDILRFHAVYWPAMLLSAAEPLPTTIVVHGFLTTGGRRMSKSSGNVVDPTALAREHGQDPLRYWLLREVPPHDDADFTDERFTRTWESALADDLGNLLNRTVAMIARYRGGVVPVPEPRPDDLASRASGAVDALHAGFVSYDPRSALAGLWGLIDAANRFVDQTAPWTLARAADDRRLDAVLYVLAETLRIVAEALRPLLPDTAARMAAQLGVDLSDDWPSALGWGRLRPQTRVGEPRPLFPKRVVAASGG